MHDFLLAVAVISGWETGQFVERHWIRPWLERKTGTEEKRSPGWGVHAFGACLDGCPWCEIERMRDA